MQNSKASPSRTKTSSPTRKGYYDFEATSELPTTVTRFSTQEFSPSGTTTMVTLSYRGDYGASAQFSDRVLTFGNINIYLPLSFYPQGDSSLAHKQFYCAVTRSMELFFARRGIRLQAKRRDLVFEIIGSGIPDIKIFASLFKSTELKK